VGRRLWLGIIFALSAGIALTARGEDNTLALMSVNIEVYAYGVIKKQ
jgi:hypothetical protein